MSLPTPYYDEDGITIFCGDTLEVIAGLAEEFAGSVSAIVTDPPYASGARTEAAKSTSGAMVRGQRWASKPIENDQMTTAGFVWLIRQTLMLSKPLLADSGNLLAFIDWRQWPNLVGAVETCNMRVNGMVVWDKLSMGLGNGFRAQHELILHASLGTCDPDDKGAGNVFKFYEDCPSVLDCPRDSNEHHPSPKPVALMQRLLRVVSAPGETILDPFMGSGTTLVAARSLGRRAIGIEIEEKYCQIAVERLAQQLLPFEDFTNPTRPEQMVVEL